MLQNVDSQEKKGGEVCTKLLAGYVSGDSISVLACVAGPSLNPEDVETVKSVFPAGEDNTFSEAKKKYMCVSGFPTLPRFLPRL